MSVLKSDGSLKTCLRDKVTEKGKLYEGRIIYTNCKRQHRGCDFVSRAGTVSYTHLLYQIGQRVGSVFQNPRTQFYNVDTTSEIVFGCENMALPVPEMRERLEETAHSLKLEKLLNRSLFALSGGEKQKIACASADAIHPDTVSYTHLSVPGLLQ